MKKSSTELLNELKSAKDYESYRNANKSSFSYMKLDRALTAKIEEKGLKKSTVIKESGMDKTYAYQILDGRKQKPDIDKVLMLCMGIGLSLEETQDLLKVTGYPMLRVRDVRDNFLIFAINHKLSIIDTNLELQKLNLKILE